MVAFHDDCPTVDAAPALLELLPAPLTPGCPQEEADARRTRQQLWVELEALWYGSLGDR